MARFVKATETKKPAAPTRKPGRPAAATAKTSAKVTKTTAAPEHAGAASPAAPKLSKDELRARVEALERANATLRIKNREAGRAAKTATARIAELEDQVARLEKQAAPPPAPADGGSKPAAPARSKRQRRSVDPGDAVPPGVAVQVLALV